MKKALVVFLILAVAGGVFAQTAVTFSGSLQTGLAIGFTDEDGDAGKPVVDFIRNRGEQGIRGDFYVNVNSGPNNSPYGNFGAQIGYRVRATNIFSDAAIAPANAPYALAWWQPNSLLWLQIGTGGPAGWGTMGGIDRSLDILDNNGLKVRLTPADGLSIVGHAFYGASGVKLFEDVNYGLGAKYSLPILDVLANFRYLAQNKDDKTEKARFGAGLNYKGLSGLGLTKIAADVGTWGFGTDTFFLGVGEAVGFATGPLTLGLKAQQYLGLGDDLSDAVIPMLFHGEISYKASSVVTVGVEGRYIIGSTGNFGKNWRNAGEFGAPDAVDGSAFAGKDVAALNISPQIVLNVGPTFTLGYNFAKDMTKDATGKTQTNLIYVMMNVSF